eukprot:760482-Hanusia_phi.AAC.7
MESERKPRRRMKLELLRRRREFCEDCRLGSNRPMTSTKGWAPSSRLSYLAGSLRLNFTSAPRAAAKSLDLLLTQVMTSASVKFPAAGLTREERAENITPPSRELEPKTRLADCKFSRQTVLRVQEEPKSSSWVTFLRLTRRAVEDTEVTSLVQLHQPPLRHSQQVLSYEIHVSPGGPQRVQEDVVGAGEVSVEDVGARVVDGDLEPFRALREEELQRRLDALQLGDRELACSLVQGLGCGIEGRLEGQPGLPRHASVHHHRISLDPLLVHVIVPGPSHASLVVVLEPVARACPALPQVRRGLEQQPWRHQLGRRVAQRRVSFHGRVGSDGQRVVGDRDRGEILHVACGDDGAAGVGEEKLALVLALVSCRAVVALLQLLLHAQASALRRDPVGGSDGRQVLDGGRNDVEGCGGEGITGRALTRLVGKLHLADDDRLVLVEGDDSKARVCERGGEGPHVVVRVQVQAEKRDLGEDEIVGVASGDDDTCPSTTSAAAHAHSEPIPVASGKVHIRPFLPETRDVVILPGVHVPSVDLRRACSADDKTAVAEGRLELRVIPRRQRLGGSCVAKGLSGDERLVVGGRGADSRGNRDDLGAGVRAHKVNVVLLPVQKVVGTVHPVRRSTDTYGNDVEGAARDCPACDGTPAPAEVGCVLHVIRHVISIPKLAVRAEVYEVPDASGGGGVDEGRGSKVRRLPSLGGAGRKRRRVETQGQGLTGARGSEVEDHPGGRDLSAIEGGGVVDKGVVHYNRVLAPEPDIAVDILQVASRDDRPALVGKDDGSSVVRRLEDDGAEGVALGVLEDDCKRGDQLPVGSRRHLQSPMRYPWNEIGVMGNGLL